MRRDLVFGTNVIQVLGETAASGGENTASVNMENKYGVKFILAAGTVTTDLIVKLQESVDDTVWTDVDHSEVVGNGPGLDRDTGLLTIAVADSDTSKQLGYAGFKQYVRASVVSGAGAIASSAEVAQDIYCEQ